MSVMLSGDDLNHGFYVSNKQYTNLKLLLKDIKIINLGNIEKIDKNNLIPNGDFEYYHIEPYGLFGGETLLKWQDVKNDSSLCIENRNNTSTFLNLIDKEYEIESFGSPDIMTPILYLPLKLKPFSGRCFVKLCCSNKRALHSKNLHGGGEYLQVKLKEKLSEGKRYVFSMYYMHDPTTELFSNTLGIKFTNCIFNVCDSLYKKNKFANADTLVSHVPIQTSKEWQLFQYEFETKGTEKYVTIGPFTNTTTNVQYLYDNLKNSTHHEAFYFIDKVELRLK